MKPTVVDLVAMIQEFGSDGATDKLNEIVEAAKKEGYTQGLEAGQQAGRRSATQFGWLKTLSWSSVGLCGLAALVIWIGTTAISCSGAEARAKAASLESCKAGDFGRCLQAYKDTKARTGVSGDEEAELYSATYKEATGKYLVPPTDNKVLKLTQKTDGYVVESGDTTVTISKH